MEKKRGPNLDERLLKKYAIMGAGIIGDTRPTRLDPILRSGLKNASGIALPDVVVHTGAGAAEMAERLGARAFTIGTKDVFFASGTFAPDTTEGKALLAHEMAHVAQGQPGTSRAGTTTQNAYEEMAREVEARVLATGDPDDSDAGSPEQTSGRARQWTDYPEHKRSNHAQRIDKSRLEDMVFDRMQSQSRRQNDRVGL